MTDPRNDRRKDPRIPTDLWIEAEAGDELYFHRAANLSAGGAFFDKTIPVPLGQVVSLRFIVPGTTHEVRCQARIVSAGEYEMGVQFLDLGEEDRAAIAALIERA